MSANRKLQAEVDGVLKKVKEGITFFDDIWEKVYAATQHSLKEKYEGDLKKEIKKLQRLRDQIKTWLSSNEIKDKSQLLECRKLIESKMEQFKICEKEMKTKAYSREGLAREAKLDPKEAEKEEKREWLSVCVDRLSEGTDSLEADLEKLAGTSKKGKNKETMERLEYRIQKNKWHVMRLELIRRLLDNDCLDPSLIDDVKDDVDHYTQEVVQDTTANTEDEFDIYETLDLDMIPTSLPNKGEDGSDLDESGEKMVVAEAAVEKVQSSEPKVEESESVESKTAKAAAAAAAAAAKKAVAGSTVASIPAVLGVATKTSAAAAKATTVTTPVKAVPKPPVTTAAATSVKSLVAPSTPASPLATPPTPISKISSTLAAPSQPTVPRIEKKPSTTAAALLTSPLLSASTVPAKAATGPGSTVPEPDVKDKKLEAKDGSSSTTTSWAHAAATKTASSVATTLPAVASLSPSLKPVVAPLPVSTTSNAFPSAVPVSPSSASTSAATTLFPPQSQLPIRNAAASASSKSSDGGAPGVSLNPYGSPPPTPPPAISAPATAAPVPPVTLSSQDLPNSSTPLSATGQGGAQAASGGVLRHNTSTAGTSAPQLLDQAMQQNATMQLLKQSLMYAPTGDGDRPSQGYTPRNPYPVHSSFPTTTVSITENPALFERLPMDTLFFAFYYQQGSYQQFLAARQLKKHSWRFHKKYMTWFQRHEEPKVTTDEYEEGTYVYFDYESGWCQRIKSEFKFEYSYLEDEASTSPQVEGARVS